MISHWHGDGTRWTTGGGLRGGIHQVIQNTVSPSRGRGGSNALRAYRHRARNDVRRWEEVGPHCQRSYLTGSRLVEKRAVGHPRLRWGDCINNVMKPDLGIESRTRTGVAKDRNVWRVLEHLFLQSIFVIHFGSGVPRLGRVVPAGSQNAVTRLRSTESRPV